MRELRRGTCRQPALVAVGLAVLPLLAHAECGWLLLVPPSLTAFTTPRPGGGVIEEWGFPAVAAWG